MLESRKKISYLEFFMSNPSDISQFSSSNQQPAPIQASGSNPLGDGVATPVDSSTLSALLNGTANLTGTVSNPNEYVSEDTGDGSESDGSSDSGDASDFIAVKQDSQSSSGGSSG